MLQPETKQKAGGTGAPAAPPAPAVPAIRNIRGIVAGARTPTTQQALKPNKLAQARAAVNGNAPATETRATPGTQKPNNFTDEQKKALQGLSDQFKDFREKGVSVDPAKVTFPANPYGGNKEDPRGPDYWANVAALEANYAAELAYIDRDQLDDDIETNMTAMELAEYNRRRKRDMGEARLGTGAAYTGQARRDQTENDTDFMTDMMRRDRQKSRRDYDRDFERSRLAARKEADMRDLYQNAAQNAADQRVGDSANNPGDAPPPKGNTGPAAQTPQQKKQEALRKEIANITKQIQKLRAQKEKAKNPKQKQKLTKQIQQLQKKRTQLQGKLGKNTTA